MISRSASELQSRLHNSGRGHGLWKLVPVFGRPSTNRFRGHCIKQRKKRRGERTMKRQDEKRVRETDCRIDISRDVGIVHPT